MKQISTGTGLVVLSGTVLASVFLSSPRTATTAFASAQQAQPAERGVGRNRGSNATMVADCQSTESLQWFSATPKEVQGCNVVSEGGSNSGTAMYIFQYSADLNNDGKKEYLVFERDYGINPNFLCLSSMETVDGVATSKLTPVFYFDRQLINDYCISIGRPSAFWVMAGLRDCDKDGDLDILIEGEGTYMYFENIGFQHAAPLEGDLNGDGHVDSEDLGRLLGGYTG